MRGNDRNDRTVLEIGTIQIAVNMTRQSQAGKSIIAILHTLKNKIKVVDLVNVHGDIVAGGAGIQ
jgi:hypothetical protein